MPLLIKYKVRLNTQNSHLTNSLKHTNNKTLCMGVKHHQEHNNSYISNIRHRFYGVSKLLFAYIFYSECSGMIPDIETTLFLYAFLHTKKSLVNFSLTRCEAVLSVNKLALSSNPSFNCYLTRCEEGLSIKKTALSDNLSFVVLL